MSILSCDKEMQEQSTEYKSVESDDEKQPNPNVESATSQRTREQSPSLPNKVMPTIELPEQSMAHIGVDLFTHNKVNGLPSSEPSSLSLETMLRMMGIGYRVIQQLKPCEKAFVVIRKRTYSGCLVVEEHLKSISGLTLNHQLTPQEWTTVRLVTTHLENQTEFCLLYHRWFDQMKEWRMATNKYRGINLFRYIFLESRSQKLLDNRMRLLGEHLSSSESIMVSTLLDLKCISMMLDSKMYMMGNHPCTLDCVVFGIVAHILYCSVESKLKQVIIKSFPNLIQHSDRIKELFWADWDQLIGKYRLCMTPRFFLSFRRSKVVSGMDKSDGTVTEIETTCEKCLEKNTVMILAKELGSQDREQCCSPREVCEKKKSCSALCPCPLEEKDSFTECK